MLNEIQDKKRKRLKIQRNEGRVNCLINKSALIFKIYSLSSHSSILFFASSSFFLFLNRCISWWFHLFYIINLHNHMIFLRYECWLIDQMNNVPTFLCIYNLLLCFVFCWASINDLTTLHNMVYWSQNIKLTFFYIKFFTLDYIVF